ncbi:PPHLN1 isoform 21, partial [Pongo abelii]
MIQKHQYFIQESDGYNRLVNIVPKKPPLLDRPGEGSY